VPSNTRRRRLLVTLAVMGSLLVGGVWAVSELTGIPLRERCVARSADGEYSLSPEQARNAATIAAVGIRKGFGERAVTIALATAIQESKLRNLAHGDRDSAGLFQQRPSQGWGTAEQVQNPGYAAGKFYDALRKVPAYSKIPVTDAAQQVQRSAFPTAYADHEDDAAVLSAALTGRSDADLSCAIRTARVPAESIGTNGLTPRAQAVRARLEREFGKQSVGGFAPGGVGTGHVEGSAHYDGRAVDVLFRPVNAENRRSGWAVAHWLVANANDLDIETVIFDGRIWSARKSGEGWRDYVYPGGPTDNPTLMHRDHVHVDVLRGG
jgi:hypothetical protein